jgi:hypothetical protein
MKCIIEISEKLMTITGAMAERRKYGELTCAKIGRILSKY